MNHLPSAPDNPSISICLQKFAKIFAVKRCTTGTVETGSKFTAGVNGTGGDIFLIFTVVVVTMAAFRIE